jgi:hypothetical protein
MNTKHQIKVEVKPEPVENHETWVKGEISTNNIAGEDVVSPHTTDLVSVSVWHGNEGKHAIHIDRDVWVYLTGLYGETLYTNTELLRGQFTLAEIVLIHSTLGEFIKGVESGTISPR